MAHTVGCEMLYFFAIDLCGSPILMSDNMHRMVLSVNLWCLWFSPTGTVPWAMVRIIPNIPDFKVHAKLLLIRRIENDESEVLYANVSTGNFNESTANVYADDSLLTSDPRITRDVENVFRLFESRYIPPEFSHLVVAPFEVRNFMLKMLNTEIRNAKAGKESWVILKINSIVDSVIAQKVYEAAQTGVKVRMIVRGICMLKPGIPGFSENIEAISIVDRFLEHSRVFVFCNGGRNKYFTSSADLMPRNLDHRIEVICPIFDRAIQQELMHMLRIELSDNTKARLLHDGRVNEYRSNGDLPVRAQYTKYAYFKKLAGSRRLRKS